MYFGDINHPSYLFLTRYFYRSKAYFFEEGMSHYAPAFFKKRFEKNNATVLRKLLFDILSSLFFKISNFSIVAFATDDLNPLNHFKIEKRYNLLERNNSSKEDEFLDSLKFKNYIKEYRSKIDFFNILNKNKTPKFFIDSYFHLLDALTILETYKYFHSSLSLNTIFINTNTNLPFITNFKPIIELTIYKPIEYYFIFYIKKYNTLSTYNIEFIINQYMEQLSPFYSRFSPGFVEKIVDETNTYYKLTKHLSVEHLESTIYSWNNYALSIVFLQLMIQYYDYLESLYPTDKDTKDTKDTKHTKDTKDNKIIKYKIFVIKFIKHLLTNIHPIPKYRLSITNTKKQFENILSIII